MGGTRPFSLFFYISQSSLVEAKIQPKLPSQADVKPNVSSGNFASLNQYPDVKPNLSLLNDLASPRCPFDLKCLKGYCFKFNQGLGCT